jgi:Uma2 family endonuclease
MTVTFPPVPHEEQQAFISTCDGVNAADAAWISKQRDAANRGLSCLSTPPEICVEVLSLSNSRAEMDEKKALYFEAGADEVWFCDLNGTMTFFAAAGELESSSACPDFPDLVLRR